MIFHIEHTTTYRYDRPVILEPHCFRMRPRCDATQRVLRHELHIVPVPAGITECSDLDGNAVSWAWFSEPADSFEVFLSCSVETLRTNPFDYIVTLPAALKLPMRLGGDLAPPLAPYVVRAERSDAVDRFARSIAERAGHETLPFLTTLNAIIWERTRKVFREHGAPNPAEATLAEQTGSCRDLAVLFMETCRAVGIPARFVSGYWHAETRREERHLHAWAEVYLPGGGWRGFDPSKGLAVAQHHVAVAAGAHPRSAAPITGSFRGTGATSELSTAIKMSYE